MKQTLHANDMALERGIGRKLIQSLHQKKRRGGFAVLEMKGKKQVPTINGLKSSQTSGGGKNWKKGEAKGNKIHETHQGKKGRAMFVGNYQKKKEVQQVEGGDQKKERKEKPSLCIAREKGGGLEQ